jgi:hypothetical protein
VELRRGRMEGGLDRMERIGGRLVRLSVREGPEGCCSSWVVERRV